MTPHEIPNETPEPFRTWLGKGLRWRRNGTKFVCQGDERGRHRDALMRVERVAWPEWSAHDDETVLILDLRCPTCNRQMSFNAFSSEVEPCGEDTAKEFPVRCDPAMHPLLVSMADGRTLQNWQRTLDMFVYENNRLRDTVVQAPFDEWEAVFVESLIRSLDADSVIITFGLIATLLKHGERFGFGQPVLVDIYDTAQQSGLVRNRDYREVDAMRKVWHTIKALQRFRVCYRGTEVRDPRTKALIATVERVPLLVEVGDIVPDNSPRGWQRSIWEEADTPIAVYLMLNQRWMQLLTQTDRAVYIAGGEVLAKLPPRQTAGAWARVMGLVLLQQFRWQKDKWQKGEPVTVSRRHVLTQVQPAKTPPEELLTNPKNRNRAPDYWRKAVELLTQAGILACRPDGDTPCTGDWEAWLDAKLKWTPGAVVKSPKQQREDATKRTGV